ncbi:MAG: hypothetical protein Q8K66_11495 [Sediminibacterium sp.]|nr:hypothetical protein [Sediminibacterium sp.]
MKSLKVVVITQARMGLNRLPGKILKKVGNQTLLEIHLSRAPQSGLATVSIYIPVNWPE